jgi:hypothetical protein
MASLLMLGAMHCVQDDRTKQSICVYYISVSSVSTTNNLPLDTILACSTLSVHSDCEPQLLSSSI